MKLSRRAAGRLLVAAAVALGVAAPWVGTPAPAAAAPAAAAPVAAAPAQQATLTVFAAASLTDAFKEIGNLFEGEKTVPVTFNFGASSQLRTQLQQGAQADVFASADQAQMNNARNDGSIAGADVTFARNRLVVIAPRNNPAGIQSAADLARPGIKFVTAAPEVPIGVYTQNMFDKMSQISVFGADFKDRANANIVSREPNVRQVVAKVQLGEADAAVVYLTDVTPQSAPDLLTIAIPDDLNTLATYPIALTSSAAQGELGQAFIDLVMSPAGQSVLEKWNFTTVGPTMRTPSTFSDLLGFQLLTAR
ncbi:MAG: molybdate ABC transporter substrate-binding protein [Chloroflexi bacterium]|nr:molybdate ABC transporter substrate-binding protein [Chloroflexota bacterium]